MKFLYLVGGAGNVYFQLLEMERKKSRYRHSDFFISSFVRNILRHTDHPDIYGELFSSRDNSGFLGLLLLPLIAIDYFLCRIFKFSLFTVFDLRSVSHEKPIFEFIYIGYFQRNVRLSDMNESNILKVISCDEMVDNVIHVRGGDFVHYCGALSKDYYRQAIEKVKFLGNSITVITDDIHFAKSIIDGLPLQGFKVTLETGDSVSDFRKLASVKRIVSSNSTFALVASVSSPRLEMAVYPKTLLSKFIVDGSISKRICEV